MNNCKKYHCIKDSNPITTECIECHDGLYLDASKECQICKDPTPIQNGYSTVCSDDDQDYEYGPCWYNKYYTQKTHLSRVKYPQNCPYYEYTANQIKQNAYNAILDII